MTDTLTRDEFIDLISPSSMKATHSPSECRLKLLRHDAEQRAIITRHEQEIAAKDAALDFALGAIHDAIGTEDGLDGATGEAVCRICVEAIEHGTFDMCKPKDLDFMTRERRRWQDIIDQQDATIARLENELCTAKDQIPPDMEGDSLSVALMKLKDACRRLEARLKPQEAV